MGMDDSAVSRPREREPGPHMQQLPSQARHLAAVAAEEPPPTMQLQSGVGSELAQELRAMADRVALVLDARRHRLSDELPDYRSTYTSIS
jgi:hypothetical protein